MERCLHSVATSNMHVPAAGVDATFFTRGRPDVSLLLEKPTDFKRIVMRLNLAELHDLREKRDPRRASNTSSWNSSCRTLTPRFDLLAASLGYGLGWHSSQGSRSILKHWLQRQGHPPGHGWMAVSRLFLVASQARPFHSFSVRFWFGWMVVNLHHGVLHPPRAPWSSPPPPKPSFLGDVHRWVRTDGLHRWG